MQQNTDHNEEVVFKIICDELDVEPSQMVPSTSLVEDLQADSLALINIVMKIEETFKIDIPDTDWRSLRTVEDVTRYVHRMSLAARATGATG